MSELIIWKKFNVTPQNCITVTEHNKIITTKVEVLVAQSCRLFATPFSVASVHGILQARILEWVAIPFSRGSSQPKDRIRVSCTADEFFTIWATSEAPKGMGHSQSKMITIILTKTIVTAITKITTNYHNNLYSLSL